MLLYSETVSHDTGLLVCVFNTLTPSFSGSWTWDVGPVVLSNCFRACLWPKLYLVLPEQQVWKGTMSQQHCFGFSQVAVLKERLSFLHFHCILLSAEKCWVDPWFFSCIICCLARSYSKIIFSGIRWIGEEIKVL